MKRVVIVGMGFGGLSAARRLAGKGVEVAMIDRHNYHLFQPLLYQVATASIEQEAIAYPVRSAARRWPDTRFHLAEVERIDLDKKQVITADDGPVDYDILILALGMVTSFFGMDDVEKHAFQLKTLSDAVALRNHILTMFEHAAQEQDAARRAALLTFVIVGGGPTGVEFAGALVELVRQVMSREFREISPDEVTIMLLESRGDLLPMVPARLRPYALRRLERMGVRVRLGAKVAGARPDRVLLEGGESIPTSTLLWAAGVKAPPLVDSLDVPRARSGRIVVQPDLTLADHPEVMVIGDLAYVEQDGAPLPTIAPVAMQQGEYAARAILKRERGETPGPFHYRDMGAMAVIGRGAAVATIFGMNLTGVFAWMTWLALHLAYLIGFRNRLVVLLGWAYDYLAFDRKIRLITWTTRHTHSHP